MFSYENKKLFIFYLGGSVAGANIEVHDVQFAVVERPEEAYEFLSSSWFGIRESLHIDAYGAVTWADGYRISLQPEPQTTDLRLYFINMGGYIQGSLKEEHEFTFLVAATDEIAKKRAKQVLLSGYKHQHRDNIMEVDDCIALEQLNGLYIHLSRSDDGESVTATWQGYKRI